MTSNFLLRLPDLYLLFLHLLLIHCSFCLPLPGLFLVILLIIVYILWKPVFLFCYIHLYHFLQHCDLPTGQKFHYAFKKFNGKFNYVIHFVFSMYIVQSGPSMLSLANKWPWSGRQDPNGRGGGVTKYNINGPDGTWWCQ